MALRSAPPSHIGVAIVLAFLAGTVDAVGFSMLGGLFVSFMSGNSTRLGVFLAQGDLGKVAQVGGIILAFVAGAGVGSALARTAGRWRRPAVLSVEAVVLALAAAISILGHGAIGAALMAAGMGLENATFVDDQGQTKINLTFMTGALVKLGEGLATASLGGPRWAWWPYGVLWLGLTAGATVGSLGYAALGLPTLFIVSGGVATLAVAFAVVERTSGPSVPSGGGANTPESR